MQLTHYRLTSRQLRSLASRHRTVHRVVRRAAHETTGVPQHTPPPPPSRPRYLAALVLITYAAGAVWVWSRKEQGDGGHGRISVNGGDSKNSEAKDVKVEQ